MLTPTYFWKLTKGNKKTLLLIRNSVWSSVAQFSLFKQSSRVQSSPQSMELLPLATELQMKLYYNSYNNVLDIIHSLVQSRWNRNIHTMTGLLITCLNYTLANNVHSLLFLTYWTSILNLNLIHIYSIINWKIFRWFD